jgi:hypothetical protein
LRGRARRFSRSESFPIFREKKDSIGLDFLFLGLTQARLHLAALFLGLGPESGPAAAGNGME